MEPVSKSYNGTFFKTRHRLAWRAPIICDPIIKLFSPHSIVEVGCGVGDLVAEFLKKKIDTCGLEGATTAVPYLMFPTEKLILHDLREPLLWKAIKFGKSDIAVCLEVAEHIEPEFVDIFIDNLQALAKNWIVMSAAPPGQGGDSHHNCQPKEYWVEKLMKYGFRRSMRNEEELKRSWEKWKNVKGVKAYYYNLLVFERVFNEPTE